MQIVIFHGYPLLPSGRTTFLKLLLENLSNQFSFRVISMNERLLRKRMFGFDKKGPRTKTRHYMHWLPYYTFGSFRTLQVLRKTKGIDMIVDIEKNSLGGVLFGRLYKIPTIVVSSGTKLQGYKNFIQRMKVSILYKIRFLARSMLDLLEYLLADVIVVPSDTPPDEP